MEAKQFIATNQQFLHRTTDNMPFAEELAERKLFELSQVFNKAGSVGECRHPFNCRDAFCNKIHGAAWLRPCPLGAECISFEANYIKCCFFHKEQITPCRYGAQCHARVCKFKH
jgi:hypothetical protein